VDSIFKYGLGGRNIIRELGAIQFLRDLYQRALLLSPTDDNEWVLQEPITRHIANQDISAAGQNFRHGATYLTASQQTAIGYANDPAGSEVLSQIQTLLRIVNRYDSRFVLAICTTNVPLCTRLRCPVSPVVFEVHGVAIEELRFETGGGPRAQCDQVRTSLVNNNAAILIEQSCFELIQPVFGERLRLYLVKQGPHNLPCLVDI
jgi:hypothetical protein